MARAVELSDNKEKSDVVLIAFARNRGVAKMVCSARKLEKTEGINFRQVPSALFPP